MIALLGDILFSCINQGKNVKSEYKGNTNNIFFKPHLYFVHQVHGATSSSFQTVWFWSCLNTLVYSDWPCWRGWYGAWSLVQSIQSNHCREVHLQFPYLKQQPFHKSNILLHYGWCILLHQVRVGEGCTSWQIQHTLHGL